MNITKIGVLGAGQMGGGIAQVAAGAGYEVVLADVSAEIVEKGKAKIAAILQKQVDKGKMTGDEKGALVSRIKTASSPADFGQADLVIEAATENLDLKLEIFGRIDQVAKADAIIATNTSSISITRLAAATKRPDKVIGMHFFNPVPVMQLVELIKGLQTSDATYAATEALTKKVGKTPVKVRNSPGFVVNRMLCPMINEAIFALGEGLATAAEIDDAMKLGCNHPIGPLALCDLIGLDVELAVMQVLFEGFKDPKYRPAPLLVEMVEAGYLGRKTGRGFHTYG
jgi:3-hydroxybutyryl-CoA dehydrogenase